MTDPVHFATLDAGPSRISLGWKPRRPDLKAKRHRHDHSEGWLKVRGRIRAPEGEWSFADESLTEAEARGLTAWLHAHAAATPAPPTISFLEPCLAFEAAPAAGGRIPLRIRFRGEAAPPWLFGDAHAVWHEGYRLTLEVLPAQLAAFAAAIDQLLP